MSEKGKCAGGYELPGLGKPCKKCGATDKEPCPEFIRQQADEIASLRTRVAEMQYEAGMYQSLYELARDRLASARKALEPFAEIAKELQPGLSDDYKNTMHWAVPTVGDFRRALVALTDEKGES